MADITPLIAAGQQIVQSYGPAGFQISGVAHAGPVIVLPQRTTVWAAQSIAELSEENFEIFLNDAPPAEIILLGCGMRMILPPHPIRDALRRHRVTLEPMDTGAACRTYNVLMAEGRRVAAAMLPPQ